MAHAWNLLCDVRDGPQLPREDVKTIVLVMSRCIRTCEGGRGNAFGRVRLCVCPVRALTSESGDV